MPKYILKLYVTDHTSRSMMAVENLKKLCREDLMGEYDLEIIDVLTHEEEAHREKILATPTLIRELPDSIARVIGDLSNKEQVLMALGIHQNH
jgi:circadian clock protein KaiB